MPPRRLSAISALALVVALGTAACSSGVGASPSALPPSASPAAPESMPPASPAPASPSSSTAPDAPASPAPSEVASATPAEEALAGRAWATAELTDVTTGETFRIADLAGRTVFVESMAIWCSNCRAQQARFEEALAQLDREQVAYVVLTVEPSESGEDLARYRTERGFTGTYAVAGTEVSKALVDEFGPNAINPPSVPLIHITPAGEVTFGTGGESVDEIVALARG